MEYYKYTGGSWDEPAVQKLEDPINPCFDGVPPGGGGGLHELVLRVDNQPLVARFDGIYLRHHATDHYFTGEGLPDDPDKADAFDFNDEGLCSIMELGNQYDVEVDFTAHHPGGYMRYYRLTARPNAGDTVDFVDQSYPAAALVPPQWSGTADTGDVARAAKDEFSTCGYILHLRASSRLQNGYYHVQWRHPQLAYYVVR